MWGLVLKWVLRFCGGFVKCLSEYWGLQKTGVVSCLFLRLYERAANKNKQTNLNHLNISAWRLFYMFNLFIILSFYVVYFLVFIKNIYFYSRLNPREKHDLRRFKNLFYVGRDILSK